METGGEETMETWSWSSLAAECWPLGVGRRKGEWGFQNFFLPIIYHRNIHG